MESPIALLKATVNKRQVASSTWRQICLGASSSQQTWARYRAQVGLVGADGENTRQRMFSRYHAILLLVRSRIHAIAKEVDYKLPSKITELDIFDLEAIADRWLLKHQATGFKCLPPAIGDIQGKQLEEVIRVALGKSLSERTIRRRCCKAGIPNYRRKARYSPRQVLAILSAIAS